MSEQIALLRLCLDESGGDVEAGLLAYECILMSGEPIAFSLKEDDGWVEVPDTFLQPVIVALSAEPRAPDIVIHNHIAAPVVNVPRQSHRHRHNINVEVPKSPPVVVNVPRQRHRHVHKINVDAGKPAEITVKMEAQEPPVVNVAAPVVNVGAPNVTVEIPAQQAAPRRVNLHKDGAGNWVGEVTGGGA